MNKQDFEPIRLEETGVPDYRVPPWVLAFVMVFTGIGIGISIVFVRLLFKVTF